MNNQKENAQVNKKSYVLAIDPGDLMSAYVLADTETLKPLRFDKIPNDELKQVLVDTISEIQERKESVDVVIERVASYGMAVGATVFTTCEWIGRFTEVAVSCGVLPQYVYRKDEKLAICGDSRAKDANIRRALIDRFAQHDLKNGRGTMKNPDWFYGFHSDIWAAYAVGVVQIERARGAYK